MRVIKPNRKGRNTMPSVVIVETEGGKYRVLINYVQRGIDYSSRTLAESEAGKLRREIEERYQKHR